MRWLLIGLVVTSSCAYAERVRYRVGNEWRSEIPLVSSAGSRTTRINGVPVPAGAVAYRFDGNGRVVFVQGATGRTPSAGTSNPASGNYLPLRSSAHERTTAINGVPVPTGATAYRFNSDGRVEYNVPPPRPQAPPRVSATPLANPPPPTARPGTTPSPSPPPKIAERPSEPRARPAGSDPCDFEERIRRNEIAGLRTQNIPRVTNPDTRDPALRSSAVYQDIANHAPRVVFQPSLSATNAHETLHAMGGRGSTGLSPSPRERAFYLGNGAAMIAPEIEFEAVRVGAYVPPEIRAMAPDTFNTYLVNNNQVVDGNGRFVRNANVSQKIFDELHAYTMDTDVVRELVAGGYRQTANGSERLEIGNLMRLLYFSGAAASALRVNDPGTYESPAFRNMFGVLATRAIRSAERALDASLEDSRNNRELLRYLNSPENSLRGVFRELLGEACFERLTNSRATAGT